MIDYTCMTAYRFKNLRWVYRERKVRRILVVSTLIAALAIWRFV